MLQVVRPAELLRFVRALHLDGSGSAPQPRPNWPLQRVLPLVCADTASCFLHPRQCGPWKQSAHTMTQRNPERKQCHLLPCDAQPAAQGQAYAGQPAEMLTPALQVTANPAARLGLRRKGAIAVGMDADLLLFRPGDLELRCH